MESLQTLRVKRKGRKARMEMRDAVRAALGAWFVVAVSGCGASKGEVDSLRSDVARLNQMNGRPLPVAERLQRVREDEAKLEARVKAEQAKESPDVTANAKPVLQAALKLADERARGDAGPPTAPSTLQAFNCYTSICKGTTTHPTEEAYRAFLATAFGGGPKQLHSWYSITRVDANGPARTATFYTGIPKASPIRSREKG
jgi:hypothetical protein